VTATATQPIRFRADVRSLGGRAIVTLPDESSARLPSRGQVAVRGVVNGHPFETVVEPDGRRGHWLELDRELQRAAGVSAGDAVTLELEPAEEWPEPEIPADFAAALADAADIHERWRDITPMARWEWVRWINATKNPDTRRRRIDVGISKLRSGKRRPCCFDLASCTDPELSKSGKLIDAG
jgi:hypothetical protein